MATVVILARILWPFFFFFGIAEGASVTCHCKVNTTTTLTSTPPLFVFWLNSTLWGGNRTELVLTNVTRTMNGSRYICVTRQGDVTRNVTYHLRVAYGPADVDTRILAPTPFITNGSRDLNLTCQVTNTYPDPWVSWTFVTCRDGVSDPCVFRPQVWKDDLMILCTATSTANQEELTRSTAVFFLELHYPPKQPPQIRTHTSNKILKTWDTIVCTVTGGKPPVRQILFNCSNPTIQGVRYTWGESGASSVSSSIIVDTTQATADHMLCTCTALWEPDPSLYGYSSTSTFLLEYKATITQFTVNASRELVVTEEDQSAVEFHCDVMGRASAEVTLRKQRTNDTLGKTVEVVGEDSGRRKIHRYVLSPARCEDMGVFTCKADSGYIGPSTRSVRLTVNCGPRLYTTTTPSTNTVIKLKGRDPAKLMLVAYPVPQHIHFAVVQSHDSRYNGSDLTPDDLFKAECVASETAQHLVSCQIGRGQVDGAHAGMYNVTVSNAFGAFQFVLDVRPVSTYGDVSDEDEDDVSDDDDDDDEEEEKEEEEEEGEDEPLLSATTTVLIAALVAATVVIVIVVFVVFILRKRRGRGRYSHSDGNRSLGGVECTRVSHSRNLAAYMAEHDNDPSNSRLPFAEVVPISSDIQFKSTDPSNAPVPFSQILPALSTDGEMREESLGPYGKENGKEDEEDNDFDDKEGFLEDKLAEREGGDGDPATGPTRSRIPSDPVGDYSTLSRDGDQANEGSIIWLDSEPESIDKPPPPYARSVSVDSPLEAYAGLDNNGAEEGTSGGLRPPKQDSFPLQSLVSSGSRSRTFITKIYLPKESDSEGKEGSGELPVGPLGDEYAVVNKKGKESKTPTRPTLQEVFATHDPDQGSVEESQTDQTKVSTAATAAETTRYTNPASRRSTAYEDVIVAGGNDSQASSDGRAPQRPQRKDNPRGTSEKTTRSEERNVGERKESTQSVHKPATESESTLATQEGHWKEADSTGEHTTKERADTRKLVKAHTSELTRSVKKADTQELDQTLPSRPPHRFLKKHEDASQGEPKTDSRKPGNREEPTTDSSKGEDKQGTLTRHRRKKTDTEDISTPQDSHDEASHSLKSPPADPSAEAPRPKKRTRKLTKRRRKSDLDSEADEAHILGP
ncbi:hypothetical protein ACOMHN_063257 [Nucella lapillus]